MALGTITVTQIQKTAQIHVDRVSFAGDGAYPAGGTLDFEGKFQAALHAAGLGSPGRKIIAVIQDDTSGYVVRYDYANDKLMVLTSNGAAPNPLLDFTNGGNLSATTFALMILSV